MSGSQNRLIGLLTDAEAEVTLLEKVLSGLGGAPEAERKTRKALTRQLTLCQRSLQDLDTFASSRDDVNLTDHIDRLIELKARLRTCEFEVASLRSSSLGWFLSLVVRRQRPAPQAEVKPQP